MIDHESLGLRAIEDITSIILRSHDLPQTLDNIVTVVSRQMQSDACSIYLLQDDGETLVLQATKGLSKSSIGKVTMKTSEGLTGLAIEQRGVVNVENAPSHPRYKYFRESKEERFNSFLGLPIMERKTPIGVIVIQTKSQRQYTAQEISALSTIAYQISSIVINAKLLDTMRLKEEERAFFEQELGKIRAAVPGEKQLAVVETTPQTLIGSATSPGFAIGKIAIISHCNDRGWVSLEKPKGREEELHRFHLALEKAKIHTLYLEKRVAERISIQDAAVFHTHLMILEDRGVIKRITDLIEQGIGAAKAVQETVDHYVAAFSQMEDPYLRERSADMEDIGRRIHECMDGNQQTRFKLTGKRIIVAEDILPSDMATLDHEKVLGIITERGDVNSHAAIMAKSLGLPAVLGVKGLMKRIAVQDEVIVDGNTGNIYLNPDKVIRSEYERLQQYFSSKRKELEGLLDLPSETSDGFSVTLRANIGLISDIKIANANGAVGVGLYRTEFPYMARKSFPDIQSQYELYRRILEGFSGQSVTIRTLDIGGDKGLPYFDHPKEDNPFMGWRSIRISLECQDIFRTQLAGILRASRHGLPRIMFPMIANVEEIRLAKAVLEDVKGELITAGHQINPDIPVGIMIELPAAVQTADILIREVDFFSIGTNDLIQYTLAADRNNPKVKQYFTPYHPAVLRGIKHVAEIAHQAGKRVSICGEMAADPLNAILLLGMGINELSVAAPALLPVKAAIRAVSQQRAEEIAAAALSFSSSNEISGYLLAVRRELKIE